MRFALTAELRHFFDKHRWIEFEGLFSSEELSHLRKEADHALSHRLESQNGTPFFLGRDIWRQSPLIRKILFRQNISELASVLFGTKPLRIAYDQYFPAAYDPPVPYSLQMLSCLHNLVGGLSIQLDDKAGKGLFFLPDLPLPPITGPTFLLVYCKAKTLYVEEKNDPHLHALKKLGYAYGDALTAETHPIVYK